MHVQVKSSIRFFSAILIIVLLVSIVSAQAFALPSSPFTYEDITPGSTIRITGYTGSDTILTIPSTIDGKTVLEIKDWSLSGKSLTEVTIPNTVTDIGVDAFYSNSISKLTILSQTIDISGAFCSNPVVEIYFAGDNVTGIYGSHNMRFNPSQLATLYAANGAGLYTYSADEGIWSVDLIEEPQKPKVPGRHELITLLSNPTDGTGVLTENLNYYLGMPELWMSTVKNMTVWLESEVFDLATAQKKAKLASGQTLLKDYNIRLMMKIVYTDGTEKIIEVDNADIKRNIPVLIPIDEFGSANNLGIIYIDTQGNTAILPVTPVTIGGKTYLRFENNHFSEYGIVSTASQTTSPSNPQSYIIQPGDTLASIAVKFGVTVQSLIKLNKIANPDLIIAGQTLLIG